VNWFLEITAKTILSILNQPIDHFEGRIFEKGKPNG
jgi:hypothetical protein